MATTTAAEVLVETASGLGQAWSLLQNGSFRKDKMLARHLCAWEVDSAQELSRAPQIFVSVSPPSFPFDLRQGLM